LGAGHKIYAFIQFGLPLSASVQHAVLVAEHGVGSGGCAGGTVTQPLAAPGYLCVYVGHQTVTGTVKFVGIENAAASGEWKEGATVVFETSQEGENTLQVVGTWAVTEE